MNQQIKHIEIVCKRAKEKHLFACKDKCRKCVLVSPMGDPKAFLIKNTVIAIRDEDSRNIKICRRVNI